MAGKQGRWPVNVKLRAEIRELQTALIRAVTRHEHDYTCGAARGLESECHCGWVEIKQLVKRYSSTSSEQQP